MAIPGQLEAAPDADLSADPLSWDWVDLSALTAANQVTITRGRSSARSSVADPASATFPLLNGGGDSGVTVGSLTPRKATGDWYPGIGRGLPLRYSVHTGQSWLALTGVAASTASIPDAASLDITGPTAIAIQLRAPFRHGLFGSANDVMGKWGAAGQRSWRILAGQTGTLNWQWSVDGTATTGESVSSLSIPSPDGGPLTWAIEFDNDNGAGGNTAVFYLLRGTITELLAGKAAYVFGDSDINSGTTSIFSSTAALEIGNITQSGFPGYAGGIDRVFIRSGTLDAGTIAVDADFTAEAPGTTSFTDDAGTPKTVTINSPAAITNRKIRLLGEYGGNKATYPGASVDGSAQRAISVAGPLRRMRIGEKPLQSALYRGIVAKASSTVVRDYYPLEDGRDATSLFHPIGGAPGGILTAGLAGDDSLVSSQPLPTVSGGQSFGWNLPVTGVTSTSAWEYTMLVYIPVPPDAGASEYLDVQRIYTTGGVISQWVIRVDDANWHLFAKDLDGTNVLSVTPVGADDRMFGAWIIVTLTVGLTGLNITYDLDVTPVGGGTFSGSGTLASLGLAAGRPRSLRNLTATTPQDGWSFGHFILTEGAATGWLAPSDTAWVGEPDTSRVFRLCRELGIKVTIDGPYGTDWPKVLAAGAQPMGPQRPLPLLTLLEECARVGNGFIGESRELWSGLCYRTGASYLNQPARLQVTPLAAGLESTDDDQNYVNQVEVSRPNGSTAAYTATGVDEPLPDGPALLYEQSREVNTYTDDDLVHQASWWVTEATWPEERTDTVTVQLMGDAALIEDVHDFTVGDVVEAGGLPASAESATLTQIADGWTETHRPASWELRPNTRPAGPWMVGVLDDDTPSVALRRLASGDSTLAEDLTTTETGVDVAFVTQRWVTTAGEAAQFPFDIIVGGEVMTVTACTATTSPQTFTVTRSVNGVVKTHATGAPVEVYEPLRLRM